MDDLDRQIQIDDKVKELDTPKTPSLMNDKLITDLKKGCTVWGRQDAGKIRKLQQAHPDWVEIVDNMDELEKITGETFDGVKQMPYFGAILTAEGKTNIDKLRDF